MLVKRYTATRLETRTKESNMYASFMVTKPESEAKAKRAVRRSDVFRPGGPVLRR